MPLTPETALRRIGRRIAELRADKGLTQQQLATKLDCSTRRVQKLEAGVTNFSVRIVVELANLLRAPLAAFVESPRSRAAPRVGRPRKSPKAKKPPKPAATGKRAKPEASRPSQPEATKSAKPGEASKRARPEAASKSSRPKGRASGPSRKR